MPTIFMPVFGEQVRNAWLANYHGYGRLVNKVNVTANELLTVMKEMLSNNKYKRNAERIKRYVTY